MVEGRTTEDTSPAEDDPIVQVPADIQARKRDDRGGLPRPFERDGITDAGSPPDNDYPGRDETTGAEDPSDPARSLTQEHSDNVGGATDQP